MADNYVVAMSVHHATVFDKLVAQIAAEGCANEQDNGLYNGGHCNSIKFNCGQLLTLYCLSTFYYLILYLQFTV